MALAETANLIVNLGLKGNFASQLGKNTRALGTFDARLDRTESRAFRVGQQIGIGIRNLTRLGLAGATAVGSIGIASLKLAGDFEAQLNTINTIARETPAGLSRIGKEIRDIARATGTPLEELTQGYYDLLSAGIKAADAQGVLAASNRLAIGGLATTAETVDLLTTAINTYGLKATQASTIADVFAKAIERGKVTAAELAGSFAQIGPIAAASGISLQEVAAGFARMTATGVPAAEAATQMRSAIVALTRRTSDLKALEKQTGRNYLSIAGKRGLVAALEQMRIDAKKAGVPLIDLLGRVEGLNFTLATTGPNFAGYNADLAAMGDAAGTAAAQMAERQKGLNFQLARLKALAKDAGITIGSKLLPKIAPIFERINQLVQDNQPGIERFGDSLAGLFTDANIRTGVAAFKTAFETVREVAPAVADAARITGTALRLAIDAFKALPPDLQRIAIAGLAINKLTGGLVTNLAGGLIGAVVKRLVSAVVNVRGGVVNVTGAGVGATGAGGVAGAGGKLGTLLAIPIAGAIVAAAVPIGEAFAGALPDWLKGPGGQGKSESQTRTQNALAEIARNTKRSGSVRDQVAATDKTTSAVEKLRGAIAPTLALTPKKLDAVSTGVDLARDASKEAGVQTKGAIADSAALTGALLGVATATTLRTGLGTQSTVRQSSAQAAHNIVGAIRANRPNISVVVNVSATTIKKTVTINERYGPSGGSAAQDSKYGSVPI